MDRNATDIVPKCAEFCSFSKNIHFVEGLCMKSRENQFFSAPEHFSKMRLGFSCQWHSLKTINFCKISISDIDFDVFYQRMLQKLLAI